MQEELRKKMCPVCRSTRVRRRRRRTIQLWIAMLLGKRLYRCGTCGHDFELSRDSAKL